MKKFFLLMMTMVTFMVSMEAQPRAIGLRLGPNVEVSYEHLFNRNQFLQVDAGAHYWFCGGDAVATYNWIFASPNWTSKGTWDWFAGLGAGAGFNVSYYDNVHRNSYVYCGIAGMIGLSYSFWFPLQLSVEIRPLIGPYFGYNHHYDNNGGFYLNALGDFAIGVRYKF